MARYSSSPQERRRRKRSSSSPHLKERRRDAMKDKKYAKPSSSSSDSSSESEPIRKSKMDVRRRRKDNSSCERPDIRHNSASKGSRRPQSRSSSPSSSREDVKKRRERPEKRVPSKREGDVSRRAASSSPEVDHRNQLRKKANSKAKRKRQETSSPEVKRHRQDSSTDSESEDEKMSRGRSPLLKKKQKQKEVRKEDVKRNRKGSSSPEVRQSRKRNSSFTEVKTKRRRQSSSPDVRGRRPGKDSSPELRKRRQDREVGLRSKNKSSSPDARKPRRLSGSSADGRIRRRKVVGRVSPSAQLRHDSSSSDTDTEPKRDKSRSTMKIKKRKDGGERVERRSIVQPSVKSRDSSISSDEDANRREKTKKREKTKETSDSNERPSKASKRSNRYGEDIDSNSERNAIEIIKQSGRNRYKGSPVVTTEPRQRDRSRRTSSGDKHREQEVRKKVPTDSGLESEGKNEENRRKMDKKKRRKDRSSSESSSRKRPESPRRKSPEHDRREDRDRRDERRRRTSPEKQPIRHKSRDQSPEVLESRRRSRESRDRRDESRDRRDGSRDRRDGSRDRRDGSRDRRDGSRDRRNESRDRRDESRRRRRRSDDDDDDNDGGRQRLRSGKRSDLLERRRNGDERDHWPSERHRRYNDSARAETRGDQRYNRNGGSFDRVSDDRRRRREESDNRNGDLNQRDSPDRKKARNILDAKNEDGKREDTLEEGEIMDDTSAAHDSKPTAENADPKNAIHESEPPKSDQANATEPEKKKEKTLMTRTGGAYIPPAKLRMMQAQITDKSSVEFQRLAWEALKKSINGLVNKVNVSNIEEIAKELLSENIVRGRGLLTRSMIQAQTASPTFTHVYAALAAIVNSKFPNIGDVLVQRLLIQFKRGFKRNDKGIIIASTRFVGHLVNQEVVHEILALEILMLLLENPTEDSVEVAVAFLKEVGEKLSQVAPRGLNAIIDRMRSILHESSVDKRVQYMIEVMMAIKKDGFKDHKAVIPELDVVPEDARYTHMKTLDDPADAQPMLNVFKQDPDYQANEEKYAALKKEMLASSSESESESGSDSGETDSDSDPEEIPKQVIVDQTETNLVALRKTIYLTIQSSLDFEECAHKMLKLEIRPGQEAEVCNMILDCCGQQRTYEKFYGLLAQRFCMLKREYMEPYHTIFKDQYQTIHRLETNKLRNVAKFFAHLLHTDAISWEVLESIRLNEEDTTSSGRIFIKFLFQDLSEYMGLPKLNARLQDETLQPHFEGIMPRDNPKHTRFAINFFTTIGLGGLTDGLRDHLKNVSKQLAEQKQKEAAVTQNSSSSSSSSSSDSDSESSSSSSSSSSDEDDRRRKRRVETSRREKRR